MTLSARDRRRPVIFGEALVDVFREGDVAGGAPFNVARHLAALGLQPLFVSRLGDDARGRMLSAEMRRFGMDPSGVQVDPEHATGEVHVDESAPGVHTFIIPPDKAWDHVSAADALAALRALPQPASVLYYGTLAQRHLSAREAVSRLRAECPGLGWCDLNWREGHVAVDLALEILRSARALKVNEAELQMVLGWLGTHDPLLAHRPAVGQQSDVVAQLCTDRSVV